MSVIHWKTEFSVDIPNIDKQHQTIVAMVNELSDAIEQKESDKEIEDIIAKLSFYAITHFADEERLMKRCAYMEAAVHKAEHADFIERVEEFKARLSNDKSVLAKDTLSFLMTWFVDHITCTDQKYAHFLAEQHILHGAV